MPFGSAVNGSQSRYLHRSATRPGSQESPAGGNCGSKYPWILAGASISDILLAMIIRPVELPDSVDVSEVCAAALPLEPDAQEFPAILAGAAPVKLRAVEDTSGTIAGVGYASTRMTSGGAVRGHVDLIAVAPGFQGQGIGTVLLRELERLLRARGASEVRLGHNSPVYLWPGVDRRYTSMISLAERAGYERYDEAVNLVVDLCGTTLDTDAAEQELAAAGIAVRRAARSDAGPLTEWLRNGPWGGSGWPAEAGAAVSHEPAGCHVACKGEEYVAFACHGVNRRAWFGPMGTSETERQRGIGAVLLRRCLADIRRAGHQTAQIAWAGPVGYYARAVGAQTDRVFWLYRKILTPQEADHD
jgi:mycothiol synthase